jgi:hypothetical protein
MKGHSVVGRSSFCGGSNSFKALVEQQVEEKFQARAIRNGVLIRAVRANTMLAKRKGASAAPVGHSSRNGIL